MFKKDDNYDHGLAGSDLASEFCSFYTLHPIIIGWRLKYWTSIDLSIWVLCYDLLHLASIVPSQFLRYDNSWVFCGYHLIDQLADMFDSNIESGLWLYPWTTIRDSWYCPFLPRICMKDFCSVQPSTSRLWLGGFCCQLWLVYDNI